MTRAEHLAWAKARALEYLDDGDKKNAIASMMSDMRKHDELADHCGIPMGTMLLMGGHLYDQREIRRWIEGFN